MTCKECLENENDFYYDDDGNMISLCPNCEDYTPEWLDEAKGGN